MNIPMTEEEMRQRMMAEMLRRGMQSGMGGEQRPQEFRKAPQGAPMDMDVVPIEMMKDHSKLITGKPKGKKKKIDPDDPNADILKVHGTGGNSVGGDSSPARGAPPPNIPLESLGSASEMQMPEALRKKKWWWE